MKKWKIFIVAHNKIFDDMYSCDVDFNSENYVFMNVSDKMLDQGYYDKYKVIDQRRLPYFKLLGSYFAESEAIYNVFINGLYEDLDYVGFLHYDYELKSEKGECGITKKINDLMDNNIQWVSFSTYDFPTDWNQKIMMDEKYPNTLSGDGRNCYIRILEHYNNYFGTNITLAQMQDKKMNLCSTLLTTRDNFIELMGFLRYVIESKYLDKFDTHHRYRFQGGMMERYIGVYSALRASNFETIQLNHHYYRKSEVQNVKHWNNNVREKISNIKKIIISYKEIFKSRDPGDS